jgi:hypothetical protein
MVFTRSEINNSIQNSDWKLKEPGIIKKMNQIPPNNSLHSVGIQTALEAEQELRNHKADSGPRILNKRLNLVLQPFVDMPFIEEKIHLEHVRWSQFEDTTVVLVNLTLEL